MAPLWAKLAAEAIALFDAHVPSVQEHFTIVDPSITTRAAYLTNVAACSAREGQGLRSGGVRLVNDNDIFIVKRTPNNTTQVVSLWVMMDSGALPIMIDKCLAE